MPQPPHEWSDAHLPHLHSLPCLGGTRLLPGLLKEPDLACLGLPTRLLKYRQEWPLQNEGQDNRLRLP